MEKIKEEVLKKWLNIEFNYVANKAGFISHKETADDELIYKSIRCLDHETVMVKNGLSTLC